MSEWSQDGSSWDTAWDDGSTMSGLSMAQSLHTALTGGQVNGFVYWYGLSDSAGTRALMRASNGSISVAKRLWAMAAYSRYVRPGATRIGATTPDGNLRLSAYRNTDGSVVVVALNTAQSAQSVTYALRGTGITTGTAVPYLTNGSGDMAPQAAVGVSGGSFTAGVPARSLVTYRITGDGGPVTTSPPPVTTTSSPATTTPPPASGACRVAYTVSAWNTGLTAAITITNTGSSPIDGWTLGFTLPPGQTITSGWNATYTPTSGAVRATNVSYNAGIPPGGSQSIGFQAGHTGDSSSPGAFALNGIACSVA
jgi:hypothetical protein